MLSDFREAACFERFGKVLRQHVNCLLKCEVCACSAYSLGVWARCSSCASFVVDLRCWAQGLFRQTWTLSHKSDRIFVAFLNQLSIMINNDIELKVRLKTIFHTLFSLHLFCLHAFQNPLKLLHPFARRSYSSQSQ